MRSRSPIPLILLAAVASAGCEEGLAPELPEVAAVAVAPAVLDLHIGDTLRLQATVTSASGDPLAGRSVFWSTERAEVATVSADGEVAGLAAGTTRVAASAGGHDAIAEVRVTRRPVGRIRVSPDSLRLVAGESAAFQAVVEDDRGQVVTGRSLSWSSSAPATATVDGDGTVRGLRPGTAEVRVEAEGVRAARPVRVVPGAPAELRRVSGDNQQGRVGSELDDPLVVRVVDAEGHPVPGTRVTWHVESGGGSVTPASADTDADGRASTRWRVGPVPGQHRVAARSGSLASVTFRAQASVGRPTSVTVEPQSAELDAIDATVQLEATARDELGNRLDAATVEWTSLSPAVATVNSQGRVRARSEGVAHVVAATEGVADTAAVSIRQRVERVDVEPDVAAISVGGSVQLTAAALDPNGHPVGSADIAWSSQHPTIATVDGGGRVTGRGAGTATIRAHADGVVGTASVTVEPRQPAAIRIVSGDGQVGARGAVLPDPLVVEVVDADGEPVAGAAVDWTASHGGSLSPTSTVTGSGGRASVHWRLGMPTRVQHAVARLRGTEASVTFDAEAR